MTEFIIRQAKLEDIPQLVDIDMQCFGADSYSKETFACYISNKKYSYVVVDEKDFIVGYLMGECIEDPQYDFMVIEDQLKDYPYHSLFCLSSIAILPEYRGKKLATRVIDAFIADIKVYDSGKKVILEVRPSNLVALSLYTRYGFVQFDKQVENYYCNPDENAIIMYIDI